MTLREAFTPELTNNLKRLTLQLKSETTAAGGRRKSRAKGQSVEFSDFRNYVPGDSIKNIDWKSYGRLDKLFIKLFSEERQANVNIVIDTSASMGFGGKKLQTQLLSTCLCYMFMLNMDRINIYALDGTPLTDLTSPNMIGRAVEYLENIEFSGEKDLLPAVKALNLRRGSCIFISDFFTNDNKTELFKLLAYKRQKLHAVTLLDKTEISPESGEDATLEDSENLKQMAVIPDKNALKRYKEALDRHLAEIANAAKKAQGRFYLAVTDVPVMKIIKELIIQ
ncbi:MAG: DUF58 domain-containing protein [Firmicutes bacterium]|nr:DUF58 domain-containing protein [Bacillota bacterium]